MRRIKKTFLTFSVISLGSLSLLGCANEKRPLVVANAGFVSTNSLPEAQGNINGIRLQALKETATTLGARGALAWRAQHINAALSKQAAYLDHIFDFNQLLLDNNVLPPILVESQDNLTLDNSKTIRTANQTYKIVAPARFVTAPPTWRTYLWMNYKKPGIPNHSLLPQSKQEAVVWDRYLKDGWQQGLMQANDIFSANLARLKRDYLGMVLYRKLLAQHMISSPVVSHATLGVTGNKNEMRIDDAISRITQDSALQLNSSDWKPILTKP